MEKTLYDILKEAESGLESQIKILKEKYVDSKWQLAQAEKALTKIQKQIDDISPKSSHG